MFRHSLHASFLRTVFAVSAVLLTLASIVVYQAARARYVATEQASVRAMVSAVGQSLAVGAYARDKVLLQELLDGLARHPTVLRVEIRDASRQALLSVAAGAGTGVARPMPEPDGDPDFGELLRSPFNQRETVGQLRLWMDSDNLSRRAGQNAVLLAGALVVIVLALLAVFNLLARRLLSRPMYILARELAQITPGTQGRVKVDPVHAEDEVGIVASAANQLLELQEAALAREREMREAIAEMEARYRGIFDSSSAGLVVLTADGQVLHANPELWRLLGCEPVKLTKLARWFADPSQMHAVMERTCASLQAESADLALYRGNGEVAWLHCMLKATECPVDGPLRIEGVLYDVTSRYERERMARHLAEHDSLTGLKSRTFIQSMLDFKVSEARSLQSSLTLMFIDLDGFKSVNDRWGHAAGDKVLIESARRLKSIFQRESDVVGRFGGDELVVLLQDRLATDSEVADLAFRLVDMLKHPFAMPNGELARIGASVGLASYPLHATSAQALIQAADAAMYAVKRAGRGSFAIAALQNGVCETESIPEERNSNRGQPERVDHVDPLTGLPDRRALLCELQRLETLMRESGGHATVICVDLDDFKSVNLTRGPQTGDLILCEAAQRLRSALQREHFVARTGSDEFVALVAMETDNRTEALAAARGISGVLNNALKRSSNSSRWSDIQASIGVSLFSRQGPAAQQVLQEAQLALRLSKTQRRGGAVFFEAEMMNAFLQQRSMEEDLRQVVAGNQLRLYVQPQVDCDGCILGGEALLRWLHPVRGLVSPTEFIPLAEASGAIVEIGRWVLQQGCELLARMNMAKTRPLTLAINVSPVQFNQAEFVEDVRHALEQANAPAEALILEITEGLLVSDLPQVGQKLRELAEIGVQFSIDDFGTGFSSLAYLRQLPLREIKIDRSFISGLPQDQASVAIVRSILSMGEHLGLRVVAEGVETPSQADFLKVNPAIVQQGWLYGRPCPADEFLHTLFRRSLSLVSPVGMA